MRNYKLKFYEYVYYCTPVFLRGTKQLAWLKTLLSALQTSNFNFTIFVSTTLFYLSFNGQVIYLEHILNDQFDLSLRRIYIDDDSGVNITPLVVFNKSEKQPSLVVYNKSENQVPTGAVFNKNAVVGNMDFIIYVPNGILTTQRIAAMNQVINKYKIAGKRYIIKTF